jgi:hypothetical protein
VKRMSFPLLVLAFMVFASVPAEAKKSSTATNAGSVPCLGGFVTWQPTTIALDLMG